MGHMIAWLSKGNQLSNLGQLQYSDFILLSKTLIELDHPEFDDAKSQFVTSFQKFDKLTDEIRTILLKFYHDKGEYTKRMALITLGKLGYSDTRNLIEQSWRTVDEEHHKMGCLSVIDESLKDSELMKHYLALADKEQGQYLKEYVDKLRENENYR
jgi:hypothetical protein